MTSPDDAASGLGFPARRLRRLRRTPALRRLVAEARLGVDDLVAPLFVREGIDAPAAIPSMPGEVQHTVDSLVVEAKRLVSLGLPGLILFGVPSHKDAQGSGAWDRDGVVQVALRAVRDAVGDELVVMADLCLDEYTDHGHCGVLGPDGEVLNDATLELYQRVALAQAEAGANVVAPSGMMDGQVAAIRAALDGSGYDQVPILAYAAKFASALYGPFRDAVDVTIAGGGDRRAYQQDPRNQREALAEIALDVAEGADMVMVKPAMTSLDILAAARRVIDVPLAAYHVSGEFAMVKAAAAAGWIDGPAVALEQLTVVKRAGADFVLTYFAAEVAEALGAEAPPATNAEWFARAQRVIPGGVDSPVRSFASVGGTPYTVVSGEGPYVTDAEGTRYIDLVQSYGAVLLGHAHPAVTSAVAAAAARGTTYGAPTPGEVLLAEAIGARVAGCAQVRLVSSGTEAAMSAVRLARGVTGRDRIVKFDGCYHGHSDGLLAGGGSGVATLGLPGSAGVSAGAVADTEVVPYNVVPQLDERVACVIVEAVAANMNLVAPAAGFLEGLRAACDAAGALLIFDEVITGFRLGEDGATGWSGVRPDLWCFGKVIGGGLPVGAFGGGRDLMAELAPAGPVYQAGTLSGNPLATAAGLAVLGEVGPSDYDALAGRVAVFAKELEAAIAAGGLAVATPTVGPLVGLFLAPAADGPIALPTDYVGARALAGNGVYPKFFHAMLRRGVALAPGPYEVLFPGLAHDEAVLTRVVEAAAESAADVASS